MKRRNAVRALAASLGGGMLGLQARRAEAIGVSDEPPESARKQPPILTRDDTRIHVREWGRGRPIVFVAPWALNSRWWDYHTATLAAQGWRTIAPDRRGHGRSDVPPFGYDFDTLADDLATVLDRVDVRDVVLVGHSMGAAEVVRYLTRHRARRVARVVLIAPTTPFIMRTADNPGGAPREAMEEGRDKLRRNFHQQIVQAAPAFFGAPAQVVPQHVQDWWVRMIVEQCSIGVMLALHREMTETDFRAELRTIEVPTLIIHGDADVSARLDTTGRPTHQLVRGSQLKIYEGAAHGLSYTHADRLLADIQAFAG